MYDWLISGNPNFAVPANIDFKGKWDSRSFDNWDEATHSLERLFSKWDSKDEQEPRLEQTASDRKLVDKYFNLCRQLAVVR
ncbi:hypothetical protein J3B02_003187 [Coemansia erecta]|nr:hypothetical protein J3B02_003187 [Coemansia erecta]